MSFDIIVDSLRGLPATIFTYVKSEAFVSLLKRFLGCCISWTVSILVGGYIVSLIIKRYLGCRVVGLTGSIASGKSTCAKVLRKNGAHICMDQLNRVITWPGFEGWTNIRKTFGWQFFESDGQLKRDELAQHVFGNNEELRKLTNCLYWPTLKFLVWDVVMHFVWNVARGWKHRQNVLYLDDALLFERKLNIICDYTILIDVTPEIQMKRLMERDSIDKEYAKKKVSSQKSNEWKKQKSSIVISNDCSFAETEQKLVFTSLSQVHASSHTPFLPTRLSYILGCTVAAIGFSVASFLWNM